LLISFVKTSN